MSKEPEHFFQQLKGSWQLHSIYNTQTDLTTLSTAITADEKKLQKIKFYDLDTDTERGKMEFYLSVDSTLVLTNMQFSYLSVSNEIQFDIMSYIVSVSIENNHLIMNSKNSNIIETYYRN